MGVRELNGRRASKKSMPAAESFLWGGWGLLFCFFNLLQILSMDSLLSFSYSVEVGPALCRGASSWVAAPVEVALGPSACAQVAPHQHPTVTPPLTRQTTKPVCVFGSVRVQVVHRRQRHQGKW